MSDLQVLRNNQGLTSRELSAISGVAEQTIISIETDQDYSARMGALIALANVFDCSVDTILGRKGFGVTSSHYSYLNMNIESSSTDSPMAERGVGQEQKLNVPMSTADGNKEAHL